MSAETENEPAIHPVVSGLKDFSEKLSPVLVKELRQGMRAHSFSILFLIVQVLLGFIVLGIALSPDNSGSGESMSRTMIALYAIAVMIIQPLRGMTALHTEIRANTIDLLVLTKLSAWRITFGKWCSLFAQSLLLLVTLVPYIIMRYFFGGMQLFSELMILCTITIMGASLIAFTVGLSANANIIVRSLIPIGCAFFGTFFILAMASHPRPFDGIIQIHSFTEDYSFLFYFAGAAFIIYLGYYFLEIGVQAIAPHAENRSTRKRLIALLVLIFGLIPMSFANYEVIMSIGVIFVCLIALDVLTEFGYFPPSVCQPFTKRGFLGRFAGRLLYPGWYTGVFFFPIIYLSVALLIRFSLGGFYSPAPGTMSYSYTTDLTYEFLGIFFAIVGQLLFAALILRLFFKKKGNHFGLFIAIQLVCMTLFLISMIFTERSGDHDLLMVFFFCPVFLSSHLYR